MKLILENWRKFIVEEETRTAAARRGIRRKTPEQEKELRRKQKRLSVPAELMPTLFKVFIGDPETFSLIHDKYDLEKSHMFGATITKVMTAQPGDEIVVWGDGSTERDLLYVDDVVDFIGLAIEKQVSAYELVNVGYGKSFSVSGVVNKIVSHSHKQLKITYDMSKPSINTKLALCSDKAKKLFGWVPRISLDEGVKKTLAWYNSNIN